MERDRFIDEILNSVNLVEKVNPNSNLFFKIEKRIGTTTVSSKTIWMAAASIAVLVLINVSLIVSASKKSDADLAHTLEKTLNKNNQLY